MNTCLPDDALPAALDEASQPYDGAPCGDLDQGGTIAFMSILQEAESA